MEEDTLHGGQGAMIQAAMAEPGAGVWTGFPAWEDTCSSWPLKRWGMMMQ